MHQAQRQESQTVYTSPAEQPSLWPHRRHAFGGTNQDSRDPRLIFLVKVIIVLPLNSLASCPTQKTLLWSILCKTDLNTLLLYMVTLIFEVIVQYCSLVMVLPLNTWNMLARSSGVRPPITSLENFHKCSREIPAPSLRGLDNRQD